MAKKKADKSEKEVAKADLERVAHASESVVPERLAQLLELFPEVESEGKVDWDNLRSALGEDVAGTDRYSFTWAGKRDAIRLLQVPSRGTLRPDDKASVDGPDTKNVFIEADNLEALKLLYKPYAGRVKLIYLDPPYNVGGDKVYHDDFSDPLDAYLRATGQVSEGGDLLTSNPDTSGRYHSSWLSMMYPRLFIARQLLRDDGIIFVSIDDHEVANLRLVMNEIFGEENALPLLVWNTGHSQQQGVFKEYHQYVLGYVRNRAALKPFSGGSGEIVAGAMKKVSKANPAGEFTFPAGTRSEAADGTELEGAWGNVEKVELVKGRFIVDDGKLKEDVTLRAGWTQMNQMKKWFAGEETLDTRGQKVLEFYFGSTGKLKCRKARERVTPSTVLTGYGTQSAATDELGALFDGTVPVDYPKPRALIKDLVDWVSEGDDIIMDLFAGSATTADAVYTLNQEDGGTRKFVMVQLPERVEADSAAASLGFETIAEVGEERLRRRLAELEAERGDQELPGDFGFRVFRLGESNIRPWEGSAELNPDHYAETAKLFTDPLVEGWKADDVVWEVALREGFGLDAALESFKEGNNEFVRIIDADRERAVLVCLDGTLEQESIDALGLGAEDVFVCRDIALTDTVAANLALQCRLKVL